ncbi:hypothetical protein U14_04493 [Candidatus Moduliflexus flocculans]|uniref:Uncharacterized protein n=1 Tax=Candidatus Moduliflexus flocculans TaxID=1499966 RepID=A0A0S6W4D9_9BACT|nr:hypothetical protein U14_04493 [Candidatus Moduliflexus flocculans]
MTLQEASDFWDEHDFAEFDDVVEVHDLSFRLTRKKYVGIDAVMYDRIRGKARELHTTADHLMKHGS